MRRSLLFTGLTWLIKLQFPQIRWIRPSELVQWQQESQRSQPLLLDAREPEEYAVSHLQSAQQIDPDMPDIASLAEVDRHQPIVVYCSVGYRSAKVAHQLQQAGFTEVYDLEGSLFQWANEGYPLWQGDRPTDQVHPYNHLWGQLLASKYRLLGHHLRSDRRA